MKKIFQQKMFLLITFLLGIQFSSIAQSFNVTVEYGALAFNSKEDYVSIVSSDENTKNSFFNYIAGMSGFNPLRNTQSGNGNFSSIPDSVFIDVEFVGYIFNNYGVIKIGQFFYKINYSDNLVYVLHQSKASLFFNDLLTGNVNNQNEMGYFNLENDAIELTEAGYKTDPDESNGKISICWGRKGAGGNSPKWGLYFLDDSDLEFSNFTYCINGITQGIISTNTRLNVKLTYLKLGVYFSLYTKAKLQRETGQYVINDDTFWTTTNWGIGEGRWRLNYKVQYKGKCNDDQEVISEGSVSPPENNKNKTGITFWEKTRGLSYYCLKVTADIFTKQVFIAPASEVYMCVPLSQAFVVSQPRYVNSMEIWPNIEFKISSKIQCQ